VSTHGIWKVSEHIRWIFKRQSIKVPIWKFKLDYPSMFSGTYSFETRQPRVLTCTIDRSLYLNIFHFVANANSLQNSEFIWFVTHIRGDETSLLSNKIFKLSLRSWMDLYFRLYVIYLFWCLRCNLCLHKGPCKSSIKSLVNYIVC